MHLSASVVTPIGDALALANSLTTPIAHIMAHTMTSNTSLSDTIPPLGINMPFDQLSPWDYEETWGSRSELEAFTPRIATTDGLPRERLEYLHNKIREFVPADKQDIVCPHPDSVPVASPGQDFKHYKSGGGNNDCV